jgi:hypothetical protein
MTGCARAKGTLNTGAVARFIAHTATATSPCGLTHGSTPAARTARRLAASSSGLNSSPRTILGPGRQPRQHARRCRRNRAVQVPHRNLPNVPPSKCMATRPTRRASIRRTRTMEMMNRRRFDTMKTTYYHAIIMAVCDRILAPGRMAEILREQQAKRRIEILSHRDQLKPGLAGTPLPKFLERWV